MYKEIGIFNAKSKLSELLQDVKRGQRFTITVRGRPIADLVPSEDNFSKNVADAVESMRNIHKIQGVSPENIMDWISEGRR
ncbi:hypothetical protein BH10PSE19_BH10PSE19_12340 [soil metagenome]